MVWLDILLGVSISLGFLLGGLLYWWSHEELDVLFKSSKIAKSILLFSALLLGIVFPLILTFAWKEIASLILFILILTLSSILYVGDNKKAVVKYAIISTILFFVFFIIVYIFYNLK